MADAILTPEQVAAQTGFAEKTLANWRSLREGPAFFKVGRLVRYRQSAIDAWFEALAPSANVTSIESRRRA